MDRKELLSGVTKLVVKIGTAALSGPDGGLDETKVNGLAEQVHALRENFPALRVCVVSSGAIGAGMNALGIRRRPARLPDLQACAAIGQGRLTAVYDLCFRRHGYHAAQLLLTRDDFNDRSRYLNASNALHAILAYGAVPIINENDTVSVAEIGFGENDALSALVANLVSADLLILLTVVDGLYEDPDAPPEKRRVVPVVTQVTDEVRQLANGTRSRGGRGGMTSKIEAARVATASGGLALIANAQQPRVLERIFDGEELGTLFLPAKFCPRSGGTEQAGAKRLASRKRWLRFGSRPKGEVRVDAGARQALVARGKSLLPAGVVSVTGVFDAGDLVAVCDEAGKEFARGLANYGSEDMQKIIGLKTADVRRLLGDRAYDEAVHRDHLVLSE